MLITPHETRRKMFETTHPFVFVLIITLSFLCILQHMDNVKMHRKLDAEKEKRKADE